MSAQPVTHCLNTRPFLQHILHRFKMAQLSWNSLLNQEFELFRHAFIYLDLHRGSENVDYYLEYTPIYRLYFSEILWRQTSSNFCSKIITKKTEAIVSQLNQYLMSIGVYMYIYIYLKKKLNLDIKFTQLLTWE